MATVLLVEDDPGVREGLGLALRRLGHGVHPAASGETALHGIGEAAVDVVVLDVMLPGLDGFEVCRRLRRDSDVPVIMLTARGDDLDIVGGLEAGADDYVVRLLRPGLPWGPHPTSAAPAGDRLSALTGPGMMDLVMPRRGPARTRGIPMVGGVPEQSRIGAESRALANQDVSGPGHDTGEDHSAHAAGRICKSCSQVIGAGQPARRRGEADWVHDVCPSPAG
jgi:CheY-like chemotaxis protein